MPVTQRHQKPGTWSLRFKANCPRSIYAAADFFDHIVVVPTRMEPIEAFSDANILANAIYTGVTHTKPDHLSLEGAGLEYWLGNPDGGVAGSIGAGFSQVAAVALSTAINSVLTGITAIQAGTLNDSGISNLGDWQLPKGLTARESLGALSVLYGSEWRITPRAKLDAGLAANLFVTTPTVVVTRNVDGQDGSYRGLAGGDLNAASDVQGYATTATAYYGDVSVSGLVVPGTPYKEFFGTDLNMVRLIDLQASTTSAATIAASAAAVSLANVRRNITLSSDTYSVGRFVQPGDYVYVWDQDAGLSDSANQIDYRGELISPIKVRVYGLTWPLAQGMGVYLRKWVAGAAVYTDLSDYIEWDTGDVQWDVGATPADIVNEASYGSPAFLGPNAAIAARSVPPPQHTFTPVRRGGGTADTLGTGGGAIASGRYDLTAGKCFFSIVWKFGTAGAVGNLGATEFDAPVPFGAANDTYQSVGSGIGTQAGVQVVFQVTRSSNTDRFILWGPAQYSAVYPGNVTFGDQWIFNGWYWI